MKGEQMLQKLSGKTRLFVKKNSATILTCVGAVGVVGTAVTAVKATPKAMRLLDAAEYEKGEELTKLEKVKVAGPAYIPSILIGTATIAAIFGANILNKRQQAAMASAYALLDSSYKEYRKKVTELYGEDADKNIRNEVVKSKYSEFDSDKEEDEILFFDEFSGRYYETTMEKVKKAEYDINRRIAVEGGAFLNDYYAMLGLDEPEYGNYLGWSQFEMLEMSWYPWLDFHYDKVEMEDGLECVIVVMGFEPTYEFYDC